MQRCPTCDSEFAEELDACPACSAREDEVRACHRCQERYRGLDACPACGALSGSAECEEHPGRDAVGRCVACGRAVCATCRVRGGRAVLCRDHAEVMVIEGWAQVYSTTREFEAQLLRENLRAEGVDAHIFSQRDKMFPVDLGDLSIVRLLVPVWEYEQARQVIQEHMDPEGEVAFACPSCGEAFELGAEACATCGAELG